MGGKTQHADVTFLQALDSPDDLILAAAADAHKLAEGRQARVDGAVRIHSDPFGELTCRRVEPSDELAPGAWRGRGCRRRRSCALMVAPTGARSMSESTRSATIAPLDEAGRSIVTREERNGTRCMVRLAFILRWGSVQQRIRLDTMA